MIPVKDGARQLARVLEAVRAQGEALRADGTELELLVIDSGSRDGSRELARAAHARVHEIAPEDFGHGRTRNLAAELTSGDAICFLTQDAVPAEGWLAAHLEALALDERVGVSYGPHLPWPDTSPMIARELEQFFGSMSPDGEPVLQRAGDQAFLSNVNACYRRACWERVRFEDLDYAEDQAFGRAMLDAGWTKAYHPRAAVFHAHDYGPVEFARRYFDEYRGLRATSGHVEPARPGRVARELGDAVGADRRWMAERGWGAGRRASWTARSALHHASRKAAAVAATRPGRLPAAVERRLSLEGRASGGGGADGGGSSAHRGRDAPARSGAAPEQPRFAAVLRHAREGTAPLTPRSARATDRERLHVAWVIPPFRRGSGGHSTIFEIVRRLEALGHSCTIWVHDATGKAPVDRPAVLRRNIVTWFAPIRAPAFAGFDAWHGADVAVATGWDTAHTVATLPHCGSRAYFIQDHEPEFFPTSAERRWAEQTYELGLFPICAGRWLHDLIAREHGCQGAWFDLGVDHGVYRPQPVQRRRDTVVFYARGATPRRAVPLGVLALEELRARHPQTRVVMFGQDAPVPTTFDHESLGVAPPAGLARAYSEAAAGLCLSLTNYSLIPQEMLACGLPCVDVQGGSSEAIFGSDGPLVLARADPLALAEALERLLTDQRHWERCSEAGIAATADVCWDRAATQVDGGLRSALGAGMTVGSGR